MDLMTKDLLINFLLTIFPIFLIQMFYLIKYIYQIEKLKGWILAFFPVLSLVLSMLFPLEINKHFVLDLRLIPFIIGGLYGGYRLGLILLVLVLSIRYFWGSEGAFYLTLIIYPLIGFIIFFLSKYYLKMTIKQKLLVNLSITLFTLIASIPILEITGVGVEIGFWVRYIVIYVIGILIATILWEGIQTNFQVLQKLIKAEKLQLASHLAASISHEVRNPLTASRGVIPMLGFKSFNTATSILSGVEAMHMIKKEQIDSRDQSIQNQKEFIHQLFGIAA